MAGELASLISRLETAVVKLEKTGECSPGAPSAPSAAVPADNGSSIPFVAAYDGIVRGPLKTFLSCSNKLGGDVITIAKMVEDAFGIQRAFLVAAGRSKKPSDADFVKMLEPTGKKIGEITQFRESKRASKQFNHLSAISDSIGALGWVSAAPTPAPYIKEMNDSGMFYTNRILKEFREKDQTQVDWVKSWVAALTELQAYVKENHTTGVSWNPSGGAALSNLGSAPSAPSGGGIPPPPPPGGMPPPPPPMAPLDMSKQKSASDDRGALFASINKGTAITESLRKVTDDMKTHKNPGLREGPKPFIAPKPSAGSKSSPPKDVVSTKAPRFVLEGKKWYVEYQNNQQGLVIGDTEMSQTIYLFKCQNTTVQVKGKVNSVIIDSCKKTGLVFDAVVSSAEIVNCQSCKLQVMKKVPTILIEKTDGCQVFLSKDSLETSIITAKSSEMNVAIPKGDEGDFTEYAIPEQFRTTLGPKGLKTEVNEQMA